MVKRDLAAGITMDGSGMEAVPNWLSELLDGFQYQFETVDKFGALFVHASKPAVFVDLWLEQLKPNTTPYTHYTLAQNRLMHQYQGLLRFDYRDPEFAEHLAWFISDSEDGELKLYGANRSENHSDPTPPEFNFAYLFEQVFGSKHLHALEQEQLYFDRFNHRRFIDYVLNRETVPIAIELNGERYHHPLLIKPKQYHSQLLKQNSLVVDGHLVYRWSDQGMADTERFADQLRDYFGDPSGFRSTPHYRLERSLSFSLLQHQEQALVKLDQDRAAEQMTSLIVLPTGTGKTEVFIEDVRRLFLADKLKRVLVIVPSRNLKRQTIARFGLRAPQLKVSEDLLTRGSDIVVQTSAYLLRHYRALERDTFDYVVVDEAHRAAAHGLRRVLEHFTPSYLLGLTATDERLDQQKLESIFGSYQVDLTLEQAIKQGLVPPIRAFRLESNIDLSEVRFNGKDYVKTDLHKTVLVPSRDQLIADALEKYFGSDSHPQLGGKQGVVFCVDIKHAKRMAKLLQQHGISAKAVSGSERSGLADYASGKVRFLCACDLINEGWDAPQTSILVMARPTMSKVLYTQQLGRGTRNYQGKEALYVIDVVDAYGAQLQPWSLHGLFGLGHYQPFADLIDTDMPSPNQELLILDGLWESERRIEPINIFNFEKEYGDLLNAEQLARELFVSTGTVKSWLKNKSISADKTLELGRQILPYFSQETVELIRQQKNLKARTEATRKEDFLEFIEKRDYTFSYKIAFLLALLSKVDDFGEAKLTEVLALYQRFYQGLLDKFGKSEKGNNPLNEVSNLEDDNYLSNSMLKNPFEKYERKRFMHHCKDLGQIAFDAVLWAALTEEDKAKLVEQYVADGKDYFSRIEISVDDTDFECFELTRWQVEPAPVEELTTTLDFYPDLKIACGHFKEGRSELVEQMQVSDVGQRLDPQRHFIACASGNSMNGGKNPICDGDYLLLEVITPNSAGSITGAVMAIERDDGFGSNEYLLRAIDKGVDGYKLRAFNPEYKVMTATDDFRTFARFKRVLRPEEVS